MQHCPDCGTGYDDELPACPQCAGDGPVYRCERCAEDYRGSAGCPVCGTLREPTTCHVHAEREARGRCIVCGRALCAECAGDARRSHLCAEHRGVRVIEGWAQVYSTTRDFEAWLVRENLRAEGIDAQIYSQRDRTFSVDLGELSIVRLLVPVWEYEAAREVIRAHMDSDGEVSFACPSCGEALDPGAVACPSCGASLD